MLVELDGRWINPEFVETVESEDAYSTLVTMNSGATVVLQAMEPQRVAEALTVYENDVRDEVDRLTHYHELGRSDPLCWPPNHMEEPFMWTTHLKDVNCNDCKNIVLARRPRN